MIPEPAPRLRPEPRPLDDPGRPDPPPGLLIVLSIVAVLAVVAFAVYAALAPADDPPGSTIPPPAYSVLAPVTVSPP